MAAAKDKKNPTPVKPGSRYPPRPPVSPPDTQSGMPETIDPRWLLKAFAVTISAAVVCAYLAVCLLVYLGGWQLMLHPTAKLDRTPTVPFQPLRFDAATTGIPRLAGWWVPAASPTGATTTILLLHDGTGSLSAASDKIDLLHTAGVNVFAFDYRGFGESAGPHPTEARMLEDSEAALAYLDETRHLTRIIPLGEGTAAVLAARLATLHPSLGAVILDNPDPDAFDRATSQGRSRLLPTRWLVRDRFDLAEATRSLTQPKLLIADSPFASPGSPADAAAARGLANQRLFRTLPDPKLTVIFAHPNSQADYRNAITRFLQSP